VAEWYGPQIQHEFTAPLFALIYCTGLHPPAVYWDFGINNYRLSVWTDYASIIICFPAVLFLKMCRQCHLLPFCIKIEPKSRFFLSLYLTHQISWFAKRIRNTNRRLINVKTTVAHINIHAHKNTTTTTTPWLYSSWRTLAASHKNTLAHMWIHTYHACMRTYIQAFIHTYIHTDRQTDKNTHATCRHTTETFTSWKVVLHVESGLKYWTDGYGEHNHVFFNSLHYDFDDEVTASRAVNPSKPKSNNMYRVT
jgi:hypothetical protein